MLDSEVKRFGNEGASEMNDKRLNNLLLWVMSVAFLVIVIVLAQGGVK